MLPLTGGDTAREALENGAHQRASISVYDASNAAGGYPLIITFTNADIIAGSLTVSKSGIGGERMDFGACVSDEMTFRVRSAALSDLNLLGQKITLAISWDYEGRYSPEVVYPFVGIVTEVSRYQGDIYDITALDSLIAFDRPFKKTEVFDHSTGNSLIYPVSVFDLVWDIAVSIGAPYISHTGMTFPLDYQSTFPNYSRNVSDIPEDKGYTYRQVLRWCAQIMGCNVGIDGGLDRVKLSLPTDTAITYIAGNRFYRTKFGEPPTDSNYGRYVSMIERNGKTVYNGQFDDNTRAIVISDNQLFSGTAATNAIGQNLLYHYIDASVIPESTRTFEGTAVPMWYLEPFDVIRFDNGAVVMITAVRHRLNGSSMIEAKTVPETAYYSPNAAFSTQQQAALGAQLDPINENVGSLEGSVSSLQSDVGSLQSSVSSLQSSVSSLQSSVSSLQSSVSSLQSSVSGLQSSVDTINGELYYKSGETFSMGPPDSVSGYLTSSGKTANFTIYLDKSVKNINTITINRLMGGIRTADQGYANGSDGTNPEKTNWLNLSQTSGSGIEVSVSKVTNSDRRLSLVIKNSNGFVTATASSGNNDIRNSPVSFAAVGHAQAFKITFS